MDLILVQDLLWFYLTVKIQKPIRKETVEGEELQRDRQL